MDDDVEIVAIGTWLYDGQVPRPISILRKPAKWAHSRHDWEADHWKESSPIPDTVDGFLYYCCLGKSGEHLTAEAAKAWADACGDR